MPVEKIPATKTQNVEQFHSNLMVGAAQNYARMAKVSDCMLSCKLQDGTFATFPCHKASLMHEFHVFR